VLDYYLLGKLPEGGKDSGKEGVASPGADKEDEEESD
jgi:hypothetical protein